MNEYIIDANILFSAFISGKEFYKNIFAKGKFYIPDFTLIEIEKYKELILAKTKLNEKKLKEFTTRLFSYLTVIPNFLISEDSIKTAFDLCKDIDKKDTMYIALSIEMNIPFITNDKKIYNGLKNKDFSNIILFNDIYILYNK